MNIIELLVISLSLCMDSFATSVCKGLEVNDNIIKKSFIVALLFAFFQTLMPILGYFFGSIISSSLMSIVYLISFLILLFLGVSMIKESESEETILGGFKPKVMTLLAISVSIDAFVVGITYSLLNINIIIPSIFNYVITFITTIVGVNIGYKFGKCLNKSAKVIGGLILISLGVTVLLSHFFN